jgi:hypothetical protein
VSAFEILVRPGSNGRANIAKVFELIQKTPWNLTETATLAHDTGKPPVKRTLACWLYEQLYNCRNNFLHGNPIEHDGLRLPASDRTFFEYAAPLYRLALTAFLPITYNVDISSIDDLQEFSDYIVDRKNFFMPQRFAEEALLTAIQGAT